MGSGRDLTLPKYSPMLEQYFGMKTKHPEAILLSRVGDFYEAYGEDAETIARALQIALTSKEAGAGQRVAMAGVPHHALAGYLAKLVKQRFVVALAEQLEVPQPNRLVRRDVVRLVTPGTLIEDQLLDGKTNNYLAAVAIAGETFALAYADVSTSYTAATALGGDNADDELFSELERIAPAEVVADVPAAMQAFVAGAIEGLGARPATLRLEVVETRERPNLDGFSIEESQAIHRALDALNAFVKRTGIFNGERGLGAPQLYRRQEFLVLDPATRKHLELTRAQGANPHATLLATLDLCMTAMGSRMLTRWILAPLVRQDAIAQRQEMVGALLVEHSQRQSLRDILRGAFDLERIAQKVRFRRATPRDLASLRRTLALLNPLRAAAVPAIEPLLDEIGDFEALLGDLTQTLVDEPPAQIADGGVIRPEADAELQECVALRSDARSRLSELEERERERTGIKTLRIKYASTFGYAIEVGKSHAGSVPADYVRKQTLTTGERYITPALKELELAISTAQSRQERLERALFEGLVERVAALAESLLRASSAIAKIDVLLALAQCAAERGYVRPEFDECSVARVEEGRHPVMEAMLRAQFVPNDLQFGRYGASLHSADRAEHGRQIDVSPPGGFVDDHGADRLVRSGQTHAPWHRRSNLHAHRSRRRSSLGTVDVLHGDGRSCGDPAALHRAIAFADRRGRARHRNARWAVYRAGDLRVLARPRGASADGALCNAFSRTVFARRPLGQRRELSHHGGREPRAWRRAGLFASRAAGQLVALVRHRGRAHGGLTRRRDRARARDCRRTIGRSGYRDPDSIAEEDAEAAACREATYVIAAGVSKTAPVAGKG